MPTIVELPDDYAGVCAVCRLPAAHKCSACGSVAYCSKEHQKQDWKQHKNACRPFDIKSSTDLGRFLVASRDLAPGSAIMVEAPLLVGPKLHYPSDEYPSVGPCLGCYRPVLADTENRCPKCHWPTCSNCPGEERRHAAECMVLKLMDPRKLRKDGPRYEIITPLRCLLLQRRKPPRKWKQLLEMEAHMKDRGAGTDAYKETQERVISCLSNYYLRSLYLLQEPGEDPVLEDCSTETVHRICGILDVNGLEIRLPHGSEILALYPTACLMEHSCMPNTKHTFDTAVDGKYKIAITASREIKKGEHITTMYTHALWGTQARREHLRATKYFSCRCQRCSDPTEMGTYLSAMRCLGTQIMAEGTSEPSEGTPCNGTQLPVSPLDDDSEWRCDRCPVVLTSAQVFDLVGRIGEEVENIQAGHPTVKDMEELLKKLLTFLHPNHYHCYAVKHSLVQLYGHQSGYQPAQLSDELVDRKIAMCRELLATTKVLDPGFGRLGLYSSVIQYELHSALLLSTKRRLQQDPPGISRQEFNKLASEIRSLLRNAISVLEPEPEFSPGSKMLELVSKSLKDAEMWMRENGLTF